MTPHEQVRELVRSISQQFFISPVIRRGALVQKKIGWWYLWRGNEMIGGAFTAKDVCRQRRRVVALEVLDTLEVFAKYPTLGRARDAFVDGVDAASDKTVEMYLRDLIIAHWEREIFNSMEEKRQ